MDGLSNSYFSSLFEALWPNRTTAKVLIYATILFKFPRHAIDKR